MANKMFSVLSELDYTRPSQPENNYIIYIDSTIIFFFFLAWFSLFYLWF